MRQTNVNIQRQSQVTVVFEEVAIASFVRQCFVVQIEASEMDGGNEVESDDSGVFCFDAVASADVANYMVPVRNFGEEQIEVEILALTQPEVTMSQIHLQAPNPGQRAEILRRSAQDCVSTKAVGEVAVTELTDGLRVTIAPNDEVFIRVEVDTKCEAEANLRRRSLLQVDSFFDIFYEVPPVRPPSKNRSLSYVEGRAETAEVVVMARNVATNETSVVSIAFVPGSIEDVLNYPHFCCVANVRLRLRLESILARALHYYEEGRVEKLKAALQMLRFVIAQTSELQCDSAAAEKECMAKAILAITDAARMIADQVSAQTSVPEEDREKAWVRGDEMRQQGLAAAAVLAYGAVGGSQALSTKGVFAKDGGQAVWGGSECSARELAAGTYQQCHSGRPDEKKVGLCCVD